MTGGSTVARSHVQRRTALVGSACTRCSSSAAAVAAASGWVGALEAVKTNGRSAAEPTQRSTHKPSKRGKLTLVVGWRWARGEEKAQQPGRTWQPHVGPASQ